MLQTIQGIYRNGKVELAEIPQDITESQVFVTFFKPESVNRASQFMSFGMFSGSQQSTEADFRDAEFNGDIDDALGWA
ncbi:hypothetical protein H6F42_01810 [Pseudanabaena sp. FACHB-1998]|uniref:hypothetical protein n=1 Tax=Pseudanabaena sp. FACHB-1998 TaxID=2692858 RepID=UPI0016816927|nr:hypothetical protein [Pseudanabaena sp. FACHB-1998]MBD2175654.1 hypothetical protein [Pseudanabaena sp. FACHB-1998]